MVFTQKQIDHMDTLLAQVKEYELDVDPRFRTASKNTMLETYNGCGADWQPEWLRDLQTEYFDMFESAFLPHDWDYRFLPKDEFHFHVANKRLLINCQKIVRAEISWWRFLQRARKMAQCMEIYLAVERLGFDGYMEAKP